MVHQNAAYNKNDPLLLGTREYEIYKEYFKEVIALIQNTYSEQPISLVDVACASGGFLYHAAKRLQLKEYVGVDFSDKLLDQARKVVTDAEFLEDSILELTTLHDRQFDVCTCLGTLSIFSDLRRPLKNLLALVKPGGSLIIYDLINNDPVDTLVSYRHANAPDDAEWIQATNSRSRETYERLLRLMEEDIAITWIDFEMPFAIPKTENPLRAWTIGTEERKHQTVLGTGQLLNYKILHVQKYGK